MAHVSSQGKHISCEVLLKSIRGGKKIHDCPATYVCQAHLTLKRLTPFEGLGMDFIFCAGHITYFKTDCLLNSQLFRSHMSISPTQPGYIPRDGRFLVQRK